MTFTCLLDAVQYYRACRFLGFGGIHYVGICRVLSIPLLTVSIFERCQGSVGTHGDRFALRALGATWQGRAF